MLLVVHPTKGGHWTPSRHKEELLRTLALKMRKIFSWKTTFCFLPFRWVQKSQTRPTPVLFGRCHCSSYFKLFSSHDLFTLSTDLVTIRWHMGCGVAGLTQYVPFSLVWLLQTYWKWQQTPNPEAQVPEGFPPLSTQSWIGKVVWCKTRRGRVRREEGNYTLDLFPIKSFAFFPILSTLLLNANGDDFISTK